MGDVKELPVKYHEKEINELRKTLFSVKHELVKHIKVKEINTLIEAIILGYETTVSTTPHYEGVRSRMFNRMFIMTSKFIAIYNVMKREHYSLDDIWIVCHLSLKHSLDQTSSLKRNTIRFMWHGPFGLMLKRRGKTHRHERLAGFNLEYIDGTNQDFDFGINYKVCAHESFLKQHDAEELLPYVCLADIALSDAFGWGLKRTQTIGEGCDYCDFRFKKHRKTMISSKRPRIQAMIDQLKENVG